MQPIIEVEDLSKLYRLGQVGTGSLRDDLKRWRYRLMGREDPFLRVGEENDRTRKAESDYVWALRDLSFTVQRGDRLGIIGRNGAGKSTLLKILSRVTEPTMGRVTLRGRVASLLEVGTGFHGDLTGRENIYLNGAILGMRRREIDRKLDEIVDFAGVEKYIDTPVKRYSSGMHLRLGFAVAAYLEPEVLIVDEVLAVGDLDFQRKCIRKMQDVSERDGRTVILVTHNLFVIKKLCANSICLRHGIISDYGNTDLVLSKYVTTELSSNTSWCRSPEYNRIRRVGFQRIAVEKMKSTRSTVLKIDILLSMVSRTEDFFIALSISGSDGINHLHFLVGEDEKIKVHHNIGECKLRVNVSLPKLIPGAYQISFWVGADYDLTYDWITNAVTFIIEDKPNPKRPIDYLYSNGPLILDAFMDTPIWTIRG